QISDITYSNDDADTKDIHPLWLSWKGVWGKPSLGSKRPENLPLGRFSAETGPEGSGQQRTVSPRK
ncbi:MAG: hypothetical protein IKH57_24325, partial [Clostridia bacterium]|nr:hypothetical protein [Clostridia bacterium]